MPRSLGTMTDKEIQEALDRGESLPGHAGTPSFVRLRPSRRPVKERQFSLERRISNMSPEERQVAAEKLLAAGWSPVGGDTIPNIKAAAEQVAAAAEAFKYPSEYQKRMKKVDEWRRTHPPQTSEKRKNLKMRKRLLKHGAEEVKIINKKFDHVLHNIRKDTAEIKKKRKGLRQLRTLAPLGGRGWHRQIQRHSDVAIKAARARARAPGKKFHMPKGLPTSYRRGNHISHVDLARDAKIKAKHDRKRTQPTWRGDLKGRRI